MPSLGELASALGGSLEGPDGSLPVRGVASIQDAGPDEVCYFGNPRYRRFLATTRSMAVITSRRVETSARNMILVGDAYEGFRKALEIFAPDRSSAFRGIHPSAVVAGDALLGEDVSVGPCAVIDREARIGESTAVGAGCYIGPGVKIGRSCSLHPRVVLEAGTLVGDRVVIHAGTVVGSDGFGFVPDPSGHRKIPQNGIVEIEDDVEIGANCAIDRAVTGSTRISRFTKLDNLIHVAHNVVIGPGCLLAAQVGISGSTSIGSGVVFGGQAGLSGHIEIGDRATIAAQAGVTKSVRAGETVSGYPARPHARALRVDAALSRLPEILDRLKGLLGPSGGEGEDAR
ncbi:UDP-3-O-(3-hydroxymyristoyl)glucosamine N-acyltransferase [Candidatus Fermentibacteria bacterium]|nr:UDP-3-O-(3-hydroxymyristoyl)glucosamine N-acyltransferase [Candidatus Fermentibacteria bacterium]